MTTTTSDDHHHNHQQLKRLHAKCDAYYAQGYLNTWCDGVRVEWTEFLHRAFNEIVPRNGKSGSLLDVGCGPSISNIISASGHCRSIVMADYLQSNREEIEKFVNRSFDAFDWSHYFSFVGRLEDKSPGEIENRTREAIKEVVFCDVTRNGNVFDADRINVADKFDVIIASLVLDVIALTDVEFEKALRVLQRHLNAHGLLILQGSLGESVYTVGSAAFPAMNIDKQRLKDLIRKVGFRVVEFELCEKLTVHYFTVLKLVENDQVF